MSTEQFRRFRFVCSYPSEPDSELAVTEIQFCILLNVGHFTGTKYLAENGCGTRSGTNSKVAPKERRELKLELTSLFVFTFLHHLSHVPISAPYLFRDLLGRGLGFFLHDL
jgi:hypothetical protein